MFFPVITGLILRKTLYGKYYIIILILCVKK